MKKTVTSALLLLLCFVVLSFTACRDSAVDLWENALYTEDVVLGDGTKTVKVEVKAEDKTVTFTVNTDKATLGDALLEHGLVDGQVDQYGLYIKVVNGITADYDTDQSYWAFYSNGEYMLTGVDGTEIFGGEHYELVYTK